MNVRFYSLTMLVLSFTVCGCMDATDAPASISAESATPAVFNAAGAPTVEFNVPDMMCPEGCGATVKTILARQPGTKDVLVDFEAKTATVAVDEGQFDAEQALAALVDKQFSNSSLRNAADAKPQAADAPVVQ